MELSQLLLLHDMTFNLDINVIAASIIVTSVVTLSGILIRTVRSIDRLTLLLGDSKIPESIFGRLYVTEVEIKEMRDWLLRNGYDRRVK